MQPKEEVFKKVKQKTNTNTVDLNPITAKITLNINRLNTPIKKHRLSDE